MSDISALLVHALNPWRKAKAWHVALSGGLDSTVLLHLLVQADTAARTTGSAIALRTTAWVDEVRIARVANRARASTSLVHHYFSTREELLAQAGAVDGDQLAVGAPE